MKNKGLIIFLITILSIIVLLLTTFTVVILTGKFKLPVISINTKESKHLILEKEYEEIFDEIKIASTSSNIKIKESNNNLIKLVVYGKEKPIIKKEENKLNIKYEAKKCKGLCLNYTISKIELYLPSNYLNTLNIDNTFGKINIDKTLDLVKIKSEYGDIKVNKANKLKIKTSAGDIKIGTVNDIILKNNFGDIKINKVTNYLSILNDCGDIKIKEVNLNKNSSIKNSLGNIKIEKINKIKIKASTDLGKKKIKNNDSKSQVTLNITNDCGDIKVNK